MVKRPGDNIEGQPIRNNKNYVSSNFNSPIRSNLSSVGLWRDRLIWSIILTVPAMYFTLFNVVGYSLPMSKLLEPYSTLSLCIASTIALLYLGSGFFHSTIQGLKQRLFNVDSLVTISTSTTYLFSWVSYILYAFSNQTLLTPDHQSAPHFYFETVTFLFTFVIIGKLIEAKAKAKSNESIKRLAHIKPRIAHLINGNSISSIPISRIRINDNLLIKPGEIIPVNSQITLGTSIIDESVITGNNPSTIKQEGDKLIAGSINKENEIRVVSQDETALAKIDRTRFSADNTVIEDVTDRIATVFVPLVIAIALIAFASWHYFLGSDSSTAMIVFVSIIMIACPYAIGLAAPTAISIGIDRLFDIGIIIKSSLSLQKLSKTNALVFSRPDMLLNQSEEKSIGSDGDKLIGDRIYQTIQSLKQLGIETYVMINNDDSYAGRIRDNLADNRIIAASSAEEKVRFVKKLSESGKKICYVGSSLDDLPAMSAANVAATSDRNELLMENCDVIINSTDSIALVRSIRLARATVSKIYQNIFFALFYNIVSVPIAAGVFSWWGIKLQPELASLIMILSSVAIIINSLTLKMVVPNRKHDIIANLAPAIIFLLFSTAFIVFVAR